MRSLTAALAVALVLLPAAPASAATPVAVPDAVALMSDSRLFGIDVLDNDSDPDGDSLQITGVGIASKGSVTASSFRLFYTPRAGQLGDDSFTYTVSDGRGGSATGTVTVTLYAPLPAPAGVSGSSSPGSFALTWSAVTGASSYRVYRNDFVVGTSATTSWTDTGLNDAGGYRYRVTALDGVGREGFASYPEAFRDPQPATPTWLDVDQTGDGTSLKLTWDAAGQGYGHWRVWRDGVAIASPSVATYVDTGLAEGRQYSYRVSRVTTLESVLTAPVLATPALSGIRLLVQELGGTGGVLGPVTAPEVAIPGGRQQSHQNGLVLQQDGEAPRAVMGDVAALYISAGGATGDLGFPVADQESGLRDGGFGQLFEGGSIWGSDYTPTTAVHWIVEDGWAANGWEEGPLGYPVDDLVDLDSGVMQEFEDGGVYWSDATGSHAVTGLMHDAYAARGATTSFLGYPIGDDVCGLRNGGCGQGFQGGSIHWSPTTGAQITSGGIRNAWASQGWENGYLGYPTTGTICGLRNGGCGQAFQGGSIHWSPATGAQITTGGIRTAWARSGWENGYMGYPTTGTICGIRNGGCWQAFQGGHIHWSPATGAQITTGAIRDAWARQGWESGRLGYPTTGTICGLRNGGCGQAFQGGSIHWSPATGAQITTGAIRDAWARQGWESGRLGYPNAGETVSGGVARQTFQGGSISVDLRTGRVTVR